MNDKKSPNQQDAYAENPQPFPSNVFTNKHTKKAINLRNRYEILLDKINTEIQRQNIQFTQNDYDNSEKSEEDPSQLYSSSLYEKKEKQKYLKEENQENIHNNNNIETGNNQKESIDDYIQKLLFELSQWNETWEKCILMATKVIKYHTISAQNTDQQRTILIDIVQRLCGSIIAETECIDTNSNNVNYSKYRELVEKRKKDKKRLHNMQKRCEKLFVEVQKNREMIELISQSRQHQTNSSNDETLSKDNFLETLIDKHHQQNIEKRKKEERITELKIHQNKNEEKFNNEMKHLHKKHKKNHTTNQSLESELSDSNDNNLNQYTYTNSNYSTSDSKHSHHKSSSISNEKKTLPKSSNNPNDYYYNTSNSIKYYNNDSDSNHYNYEDSDSEPDSMLYSNSYNKPKSHIENNNTKDNKNSDSHETDSMKSNESNKNYSHNLKKMISIVNGLEKSCAQMQTNLNNQLPKNEKNINDHSSVYSNQNRTQINGNELSLDSLEKIHLSLAEVERNFSTS
ncbi:hypothetical protein M9Y10_013929 [Tritrichomonas musculus]|uniref:Uncharacterized protein n=1 Tax=Tritrichomonas musculus TaxID=1915356 RepID=A0ABR2KZA6_9EUKA